MKIYRLQAHPYRLKFTHVRFLHLVLLIDLAACGAPEAVVRTPVKTDGITPKDIVQKNNANGANLRYIKSVTTLNMESPKSVGQYSAQIAIRTPDSVYIKIEGILGIDGLKASLNKESFVVYNIINKYVVMGRTSSEAIRKTFDYDVSFDEMMELLTGLPRLRETDLASMTRFAAEESYYTMSFTTERGVRKIWIDPFANYAVSRIVDSDSAGEIMVEREFSRFQAVGDVFFPRYVRIVRPKEKDLLSLYFEARSINKPFSSNLFLIRYPRDIEIIQAK